MIQPSDAEALRVVEGGLQRAMPFHGGKNSVADAVILQLYRTAKERADLAKQPQPCDYQPHRLLPFHWRRARAARRHRELVRWGRSP